MRSLLAGGIAAVLAATLLLCACSFGSYGTRGGRIGPEPPKFIEAGKTKKAEVLTALGEPDAIEREADSEVLTYRAASGYYIFLFGRNVRDDLVIRCEGEIVTSVEARRVGDGLGILAPPFPDLR